MGMTIAIVGKGGTGKTTIAALLIKLLSEKSVVLAIDGDPSSNLNMALGLPLIDTVGHVREDMAAQVHSGRFEVGISKPDYLELKIRESLVESERIDLLAMGRPEGPGCYCAANEMMRGSIGRLADNYDYVVIDCEAGMEHISRQTTRDVDLLLVISDPSIRSITTATRMKDLISELRTNVGRVCLVLNRIRSEPSAEIREVIESSNLQLIAMIAEDSQIMDLDATGVPLTKLPSDSPLQVGVLEIAKKLGLL